MRVGSDGKARANLEESLSKAGSSPGAPDKGASLPPADWDNFWEAPARYWKKIVITEAEMGLIESGGADRDFLH